MLSRVHVCAYVFKKLYLCNPIMPGGFLRASMCRSVNSHAFGRAWRLGNLGTEESFLVVIF